MWDGVYTQAQSARAEGIAAKSCAPCHGDKLAGTDIGPALRGDDFLSSWIGKTTIDLFGKLTDTMPADTPGSLKPQQYADLIAYIFSLNDAPAGAADLTADPASLKLLRITTKP